MSTGRFDTTTKTKLTTKYGKILKVTHFEYCIEYAEYKIKPTCSICGGDVGCVCYNDDNSDAPFDSAIKGLQQEWCCEKSQCICDYVKKNNPKEYKKLTDKYGDDIWSISEVIQEEWGDYGEDIFCGV